MSEFARGGVIPGREPIPMIAEGFRLALDRSPEMREAFRKFIETSLELHSWIEGRPRRTAMHTAYRAKTRRRNRRRK